MFSTFLCINFRDVSCFSLFDDGSDEFFFSRCICFSVIRIQRAEFSLQILVFSCFVRIGVKIIPYCDIVVPGFALPFYDVYVMRSDIVISDYE